MDTVLIVDGDVELLEDLKASLEKLQQFQVRTASSGSEALDILKNGRVAIFVTDIQAPELDCLELLSYMSQKHPNTPCIVTTDWGKPWYRAGLDHQTFLYHLEKPFTVSAIAAAIFVGLNLRDEGLNRKGMTMASILPLVDLQQKTCRMQIVSTKGKGYLYFDKGVLFDAHYGDLYGESAAREISKWSNISFQLSELPRHRTRRRVKTNLMDIADAGWQKEEVMTAPVEEAPTEEVETEPVIDLLEETDTPFEVDWEKSGELLQAFLSGIKAVSGYLAFALVDAKGKTLALDQNSDTLDISQVARDMRPLFINARQTALRGGLEEANALTLHGANATVRMQRFQMELFILVACSPAGNWDEIKSRLDRILASLEAA
jgi:CheY-like chemotaxis protein